MKIGKEKSLSPYNSAQNWSCPIYHLDLLMPAISPGSTAVTVCVLVAKLCLTLCDLMDCSPPGSSVYGGSPGKNTGVGCHALLQGIFPTQESNPGLLDCRQILYHVSQQGSPNNLY